MKERVRSGIAGAGLRGGWAAGHLLAPALLDEPALIAVATGDQAMARAVADDFGVPHVPAMDAIEKAATTGVAA